MPTLFCTFCGEKWDTKVDSFWICPECEMSGAPNYVVDSDLSEVSYLQSQINQYREPSTIKMQLAKLGGAVFPAFIHEAYLSEELLDLLVIFFDKVLLNIDTFNVPDDIHRFNNKVDAYRENGFISIFSWDSNIITEISNRKPDLYPPGGATPLVNLIYKYSQILTYYDLKNITHDRIKKIISETDAIDWWNGDIDMTLYMGIPEHLLNRLNGFDILCRTFGFSMLTDRSLSKMQSLKNTINLDDQHKKMDIIFQSQIGTPI